MNSEEVLHGEERPQGASRTTKNRAEKTADRLPDGPSWFEGRFAAASP